MKTIEEKRLFNVPPQIIWNIHNKSDFVPSFSANDDCEWIDIGSFAIEDDMDEKGVMSVLSLKSSMGNLRLASVSGLSFSNGSGYNGMVYHRDDRHKDKHVEAKGLRFDGTLKEINKALSRIQYTSCNPDGKDEGKWLEIVLEVDDNGFSGKGGSLTNNLSIEIPFYGLL